MVARRERMMRYDRQRDHMATVRAERRARRKALRTPREEQDAKEIALYFTIVGLLLLFALVASAMSRGF